MIAEPPSFADIQARLAALRDLRAEQSTSPPGGATPGQLDAMRESMEILSDPHMMRRVRAGRQAVAAGDLVALEAAGEPAQEPAGSAPALTGWRVMLTGPVARELAQLDPEPAAATRELLTALGEDPAGQGRALGMGLVGLFRASGASHRILYAIHEGQRLVTVVSLDDR